MRYKATTSVVNRFGKRYEADKDGVIVADSPEIAKIFESMGFTSLEVKEEVKVTKKNAKI